MLSSIDSPSDLRDHELPDPERRAQIEAGYRAIQGMFWGSRISLDEARSLIIEWLLRNRLLTATGAVMLRSDFETLAETNVAWIHAATIHRMSRRLCPAEGLSLG